MAVKIVDRGWNRIEKEVETFKNSYSKVGLPEDATAKKGKQKGSGHSSLFMSELITIGAVHEFGAPKKGIPERPFMRTSFDENKKDIYEFIDRTYNEVLAGFYSAKVAVGRMGAFMQAKTQKKIRSLTTPPLAEKTIERKHSSKLLIDTGQLIQSIQHVEAML